MKILILKPSSLGDVIQALPVLRLLKRHYPAAEIFWWIDSALAPLLEGDPDLAGIVRFERKRWSRPAHWPEMFRSIRRLRAQHFDLVIDLQCLARSGAFAWLARGKFLIGLDEVREGARGFYDVAVPRQSFHTHAVDWYLSVLPPLGEFIAQAAPARCVNLCGATSLLEMVEWIRLGDLLVTNDTGPMHAAAALGKPLVALFGPTEPRRTGPYGQLENVLRLDLSCSPCLQSACHFERPDECLRALVPAQVLAAVVKNFD